MNDRYSRIHFMPVVSASDYLERDLILNNWDLFEIKRPVMFESIKRIDIQRPDLMSLRIYGNMSYWWILLKINSIDCVWCDMTIGQDIIVPDVGDIRDWILKVKSRLRKVQN